MELYFTEEVVSKPLEVVSGDNPISEQTTEDSIEEYEQSLVEDVSDELKAAELSTMHLEDPLRYEELLSNDEALREFNEELELKGV